MLSLQWAQVGSPIRNSTSHAVQPPPKKAFLFRALPTQLNMSTYPSRRPLAWARTVEEWKEQRLGVKAQLLGLALSDLAPPTATSQALVSSYV